MLLNVDNTFSYYFFISESPFPCFDCWILNIITFWPFENEKVVKIQENLNILNKNGPYTQNLAKQPIISFVLKVLSVIFYPNHAQQLKNELKGNFLGTPCTYPTYTRKSNCAFLFLGFVINLWSQWPPQCLETEVCFPGGGGLPPPCQVHQKIYYVK